MAVHMATASAILNTDERCLIPSLQDAAKKLDSAEGESVLDFSSVHRVDAGALRALEELAGIADEKSVKVMLRGTRVDVYKVLKLVKLTRRFSFD
jgi:anti-anti-sigma regulatory factor